jgi:hypothetical protein
MIGDKQMTNVVYYEFSTTLLSRFSMKTTCRIFFKCDLFFAPALEEPSMLSGQPPTSIYY